MRINRTLLTKIQFNNLKYYYYIALFILYVMLYFLVKMSEDSFLRIILAIFIFILVPALISNAGLIFFFYPIYWLVENKRFIVNKSKFYLNCFFYYLFLLTAFAIIFFIFYSIVYFLTPILFILFFYILGLYSEYFIPSYSRYCRIMNSRSFL